MLNPYPRLFRLVLLLFGLLSVRFTHAQQVYPVLSTLQINPPYSLYLNDYASAGSDKMQVNLFLKDLTKSNYPCRLRFKLEGFGITIQNKNDFYVQPFYLNPGELSSFSGSDLEPYFNPKNLVFQGLNPADYSRNGGKLPEGVYRISVEVLDYYQRSVVSNAGSTMLAIHLSYPPIINSPLPFSKVQALEPQNVIFQWVPRHTGSINAAYNVAYNFRLVELIPPDRDPNDAIRSTRPLFETVTDQTILLYGPAEPTLTPGNSYAVQVQAIEAEGKDLFINNGNSEVVKFTYGDKCAPPLHILAQLNDQTSLKFTWDALPLQQAFTLRYREADNRTAEWFEQETYTPQYIARGLRPGKTYQYQVKAQCMNGYGDYTPIQQFQMPDEQFSQGDFVCGKQPESAKPDKKQLLDNLLSGNVFTAGDFSVTVTSITASQNGKFSGTGTITVPVLSNLQFSVVFNKVSINSKYQLVDGVVKVGVQGLETLQQGNGLKELSAALSGLSDAFDDLLKELRKDKPDPEVLTQKVGSISSDMGSLPKTGNESVQKSVEGLNTLIEKYNSPTVWASLDDPASKDAVISDFIKGQENAKEMIREAAELEKVASISSNCSASAPNTKGAEGELKVTKGIIYGSRVGAECEQNWVYYTGGLLKKLVKADKPAGWYRQEEYAKIMTPVIQAIGILNGDIRAIDKETYRKGSLFTLEKLLEQNPSDQFITSISPYYKSICKELDLQLSGSGMLEPVYIEFDLVLMFTSIGELKAAFNLARAGGLFTRSVAKEGVTILGKYPDYINLASELAAKRFNIPTNIWNKMSVAERWIANQKFLDRMILRGDKIVLSNPVLNINKVSGAFRQELEYLIGKGYKLNSTGTQMIK